jgi:hypothetical protein
LGFLGSIEKSDKSSKRVFFFFFVCVCVSWSVLLFSPFFFSKEVVWVFFDFCFRDSPKNFLVLKKKKHHRFISRCSILLFGFFSISHVVPHKNDEHRKKRIDLCDSQK